MIHYSDNYNELHMNIYAHGLVEWHQSLYDWILHILIVILVINVVVQKAS